MACSYGFFEWNKGTKIESGISSKLQTAIIVGKAEHVQFRDKLMYNITQASTAYRKLVIAFERQAPAQDIQCLFDIAKMLYSKVQWKLKKSWITINEQPDVKNGYFSKVILASGYIDYKIQETFANIQHYLQKTALEQEAVHALCKMNEQ